MHNLCRDGVLTKIRPPRGRKNHPAGAAVITAESVERLLAKRGASPKQPRRAAPQDGGVSSPAASVQLFKVNSDVALEALRRQRRDLEKRRKFLTKELKEVDESMRTLQRDIDQITNAYLDALSLAYTPDNPEGLSGHSATPATGPWEVTD